MKKHILCLLLPVLVLASCKEDTLDKSDALTSGRGFIEASLKGDYVKAGAYVLPDSTNEQYLANLKAFNAKLTPLERESYRDADIIIDSTKQLNDSTALIYYKNTYKKEPTKLQVVRKGNEWLVDFKYTFTGDEQK